MTRRFARLRRGTADTGVEYSVVPDDGMCLNAFLVVDRIDRPGEVLMGRPDPAGPWPEVGALGADRLARIADRWMLPASQLLLLEGPDEAARRIAREMLGRSPIEPGIPRIFSETYERPAGGTTDPHWDLHFVYRMSWSGAAPDPGRLWKALEYRPVRGRPAEEFARGHQDVLALVGLWST